MTGLHIFDSHLAAANAWLWPLIQELELGPDEHARALHALRAGLHTIRDRLPAVEAVDLAAQLPTLLRGIYFEGWQLDNDPARIRDRAAMLARVKKELGAESTLAAYDVLRAVVHLLVRHVSAGEIRDVVSTLPRPVAVLWNELSASAEPAAQTAEPPAPHRTGYAR